MNQPVKIGQELILEIKSKGRKGDGIAEVKGFIVIVKDAVQGLSYSVKITKVFRKFAIAEIIEADGEII